MPYSDEIVEQVLQKIEENIVEENNCLTWVPKLEPGRLPTVNVKGKTYNVKEFLWALAHPDDPVDPKKHNITRICYNQKCYQPYHHVKMSKNKNNFSTDIGKILDERSYEDNDNCVIWNGGEELVDTFGYGRIKLNHKWYSVSELSYKINNDIDELSKNDKGETPKVLPFCGKSLCISPFCLELKYPSKEDETNLKIIEKMNLNIVKNDNGCLIWQGEFTKYQLCRMGYGGKRYFLHNFLWEYYHPGDVCDDKHKIARSCQDLKCLNIDHLYKVPLKQEYNKDKLWERMLSKTVENENGCLIWQGSLHEANYGMINAYDGLYSAHRLSYIIHNYEGLEDIPEYDEEGNRLVVRHICNDERCILGRHLVLGTQIKNCYDDKIANGTLRRGEEIKNSKITKELAIAIRNSKKDKNDKDYKTQKERAKFFNTTENIVAGIDSGDWAWTEGIDNSKLRKRRRESRRKAMKRVWTQEMREKAYERVKANCIESETIQTPFVTTPCLLWQGYCQFGYGKVSIFGRRTRAHILACECNEKMKTPKGFEVAHKCNVKNCCNPDHLSFKTKRGNRLDAFEHGTLKAKLTVEQVKEIKLNVDKLSCSALGRKYKVARETVRRIIIGAAWSHIIVESKSENPVQGITDVEPNPVEDSDYDSEYDSEYDFDYDSDYDSEYDSEYDFDYDSDYDSEYDSYYDYESDYDSDFNKDIDLGLGSDSDDDSYNYENPDSDSDEFILEPDDDDYFDGDVDFGPENDSDSSDFSSEYDSDYDSDFEGDSNDI